MAIQAILYFWYALLYSRDLGGTLFIIRNPPQVEDTIFHIPVRRLKQSQYFRDMIDDMHTGNESEGKSDDHPIVLGGISAFEMASFLDVLDTPFVFGDPGFSFEQWAAALHLATMWSFDDLRNSIFPQMDDMTADANPFDVINASLKCRVEHWLHPAYEALCRREDSFTDDEVEWLGIKRAAALWRIRESFEFDKSVQFLSSSPCCGHSMSCRSCQNVVPQNQSPSKKRRLNPKARVVVQVRDASSSGSPRPIANHVVELIKMEGALKFV
ncbi:hypothetical protein FRC00_001321 [Tulasnella sp. 408]|nr:hypothetical protein FRC00_001321 [Tulasnella sp. 408]